MGYVQNNQILILCQAKSPKNTKAKMDKKRKKVQEISKRLTWKAYPVDLIGNWYFNFKNGRAILFLGLIYLFIFILSRILRFVFWKPFWHAS